MLMVLRRRRFFCSTSTAFSSRSISSAASSTLSSSTSMRSFCSFTRASKDRTAVPLRFISSFAAKSDVRARSPPSIASCSLRRSAGSSA